MSRVHLSKHRKPDLAALASLLDEVWDPIGVYRGPEDDRPNPGEYENYAGRIWSRLSAGDDPSDLASLLADIEQDEIGLPTTGRELSVAETLIDWYQGHK